jgi:hypothetical protein
MAQVHYERLIVCRFLSPQLVVEMGGNHPPGSARLHRHDRTEKSNTIKPTRYSQKNG